MKLISKSAIKNVLGKIPLTAEAYWYIRTPGKPISAEFSLRRLEKLLPAWRQQAEAALLPSPGERGAGSEGNHPKRIFLFGTLRYWIEHAALLSTALAGQGHTVTFSYLPYAHWQRPLDRFNLRRHNIYAHKVLKQLEPLVHIHPLLSLVGASQPPAIGGLTQKSRLTPSPLSAALDEAVRLVALRDTQYTLQVEEVSQDSACTACAWSATSKPPRPLWPGWKNSARSWSCCPTAPSWSLACSIRWPAT
jgi:hypothetical protein